MNRTCPRCLAEMPEPACKACGYPKLKPQVGWCRHPELRLIEYGEHIGKLECLTPGCQARFSINGREGRGGGASYLFRHTRQYRWYRAPDDLDAYRQERRQELEQPATGSFYDGVPANSFYTIGLSKEDSACSYLLCLTPDNDWAQPPDNGWNWIKRKADPAFIKALGEYMAKALDEDIIMGRVRIPTDDIKPIPGIPLAVQQAANAIKDIQARQEQDILSRYTTKAIPEELRYLFAEQSYLQSPASDAEQVPIGRLELPSGQSTRQHVPHTHDTTPATDACGEVCNYVAGGSVARVCHDGDGCAGVDSEGKVRCTCVPLVGPEFEIPEVAQNALLDDGTLARIILALDAERFRADYPEVTCVRWRKLSPEQGAEAGK